MELTFELLFGQMLCGVSVILNFVYIPFQIQDDILDVYNSIKLNCILQISNTKASHCGCVPSILSIII